MLEWVKNTLYYSLIYEDRYKYIIEGLFNTILIAMRHTFIQMIFYVVLSIVALITSYIFVYYFGILGASINYFLIMFSSFVIFLVIFLFKLSKLSKNVD